MSHHFILSTGALALATGATLAVAPPAVSSDRYAGPNGAITSQCDRSAQRISYGLLYDKNGKAHPTARWNLYSSGANGDTRCLTVFDHRPGSHRMSAMVRPVDNFHDGAKAAGVFHERTPSVSVKKVAKQCVGFTAELTENGTFYQRNLDSYCRW